MKTVDVIGAGIGGLSAAHFLSQRKDLRVRVWEKEASPGGLAGNFLLDGAPVEKFYHHLFTGDGDLRALIDELGLGASLSWRPAKTGSYYFNRPFRLSSPLDLLRFKPLPFLDRLRMGLLVLKARRVRDWTPLDDISAETFIRRHGGEKVFRVVWEPLLRGKFGVFAGDVSAAWLWSKLVDRGGSRDQAGREVLGYVEGGFQTIFDALRRRLEAGGREVLTGRAVKGILLDGRGRVRALKTDAGEVPTDAVLSCTQLPETADLLPDSLSDYRASLRKIRYLGNVCLVMMMDRPLSHFYWTNVTDPSAPFVGVIEQSNWMEVPGGGKRHLAYISAYVPPGDPRPGLSTDALFDLYLPHLRKMFPHFDRSAVTSMAKWTHPYTQPVPHVGYRKDIPAMKSPVSNLWICTMAQIYPADRGLSQGVALARAAAEAVSAALERE